MKRLALAAILMLALPATAQVPSGDMTVSATAPGVYIDPQGSMTIPATINVGCALLVTSGGSGSVALSAEVPEYVDVSGDTVSFSAQDCSGSTSAASKTGNVVLSPQMGAPGLQAFNAKIIATFTAASGGTNQADTTIEGLAVDYLGGHTLSLEGDQTFQVEGDSHTFTLDVEITANTKTMVMFLEPNVSRGSVSGLGHKVFDVLAGETNKTYTITYTAPDGGWEQETFTFYNYSHCLDKTEGCDPLFESRPTWTFVNAAGNTTAAGGDDKDSPGPAIPMLVAGLALLAFAIRRRE